ncbi:MAG: DEAD/DEAH box helicase family protein, partial [Candidatus Paceibacterota bacterium]
MLRDVKWSESRSYRSKTEDEPFQFYLDGLSNSNSLDLLLGYFSSAAISVLSLGFATFLYNKGVVRMVINNILSEQDKNTILEAREGDYPYNKFDLSNIREIKNNLSDYNRHFFECLAWLIANDKIQIKVIKPKVGNGISHFKSGVFSDGKGIVGFTGSCNFTAHGLVENLEKISTFLKWENSRSSIEINSIKKDFENYFFERDENVEYLDPSEIRTVIKEQFAGKTELELLIQEKELLKKKEQITDNRFVRKTIEKLITQIELIARGPRFPYPSGPREYQVEAYKNWVKNNFKGIFAMATGTGKTITSLNCLLNDYLKTKIYRAIIIVPTIALVEQWKKECAKFNFNNIIVVSSKENWDKNLAFFNTASKLIDTSYIVIVTYASLPRQMFQSYFKQLPKDTILIADETHNLASKGLIRLLSNVHLEKRIGLSATPQRKFDETGNQAIQTFFNDTPPYIVSYSMEEALKIGWLCKYTYHPHLVKLKDQELEKYKDLSLQLLRMGLFDKDTGSFRSTPEIEKKLLERKRIIH